MTSSTPGRSRAACAPPGEVSTVTVRPKPDAAGARIAGPVMTTSPVASSRTARRRRAASHATRSAPGGETGCGGPRGHRGSPPDPLDDPGRRAVGLVGQDDHRAAELLDDGRLGQEVAGVVASLDEDIGADDAGEPAGIVLPEGHDMVAARERRRPLHAIPEPVDRPLVALEAAHPRIGVDTANQDVAEALRPVEVRGVAPVQDVEAPVREDDPVAPGTVEAHLLRHLIA